MHVGGFDWDSGNWPKCGKHGVSREEIEAVFHSAETIYLDDKVHSRSERRWLAISKTVPGHHGLLVGFTFRQRDGRSLIRPISARFMHRKEVGQYGEDR